MFRKKIVTKIIPVLKFKDFLLSLKRVKPNKTKQ